MNMQDTLQEIKAFKRHNPNTALIVAALLLSVMLILFGALMQGCEGAQVQVTPVHPSPAPVDGESAPVTPPPAPKQSDIEVVAVEATGKINAKVKVRIFGEVLTLALSGDGAGSLGDGAGCFDVGLQWGIIQINQQFPSKCK